MQKSLSYYRQLLDRYLDNAISQEEATELFEFIREQPEASASLLEALRGADFGDRFRHLENIDASTGKRMYDKLFRTVSPEQDELHTLPLVHRVHFLKTGWFRYAVAVVLVAGGVSFFLMNNKKEEQPLAENNKPVQTDIGPGSNKATLTLADGSNLVLDEVQTGSTVQQGNSKIVKLDSGRVAYEAAGTTQKISWNTLTVPKGGHYSLTLADGTKVWLNAASSLKYPTAFTGSERTVELTGEAYLEVAKQSKQPFVVKTKSTDILVLGTSLNVNAYPDESSIKTTLIDGSVKVGKASSTAKILIPGQQAETTEGSDGVKVETVDTELVLAWKNGLFSFNNADIKTVMRQLSRWYDINIVYEKGVPAQRFFGEMNRSLSLSQVLKGLEVTNVNFRLEGRNLIVMP